MDLPSLLSCKRQINYLSLSRIGLQLSHTREAIKRESGVNPEQSRCCKFHRYVASNLLKATGRVFREGARNRNKSEDLPCKIRFTAFEEKALNLMTRTSVYHFIHHSDSEKVCTN